MRTPDPIDIGIGRRIRSRRLLLRFTQRAMARSLGVSFQQLQKYENGTNRVSPHRLQTINAILKAPPTYFFGNQAAPSSTVEDDPSDDFMTNAEAMALSEVG